MAKAGWSIAKKGGHQSTQQAHFKQEFQEFQELRTYQKLGVADRGDEIASKMVALKIAIVLTVLAV